MRVLITLACVVLFIRAKMPIDEFNTLLNETTEIATKEKLNIDYVPGVVSVISGDELSEMGIPYLTLDKFRVFPGFSGVFSRASMDFTKYVVMINGISLHTQLTGTSSLPLLSTRAIERIEVIRGPSSALYGANALTSIINIITKQNENLAWIDQYWYSADHQIFSQGALLHYAEGDLRLSMRFHHVGTDGVDQEITQDAALLAGSKTYAPAKVDYGKDAYDIGFILKHQNWKLDYERSKITEVAGYGLANTYLQPSRDDHDITETRDLAEATHNQTLGLWKLNSTLGAMVFTQKTRNAYIAPVGASDYVIDYQFTEQDFYATLEATRNFNNHKMLFGSRYFQAKVTETEYATTVDPTTFTIYTAPTDIGEALPKVTRKIQSYWLQDHYYFNDYLSSVINLRYDDVSDINEDIITPRLALIYQYNDHHIFKAQYAQAFMTPIFYLLYSTDKSIISANPDLGMDKSHNYEVSHIYKGLGQSIKTTFYFTDMYKVHTFIESGGIVTEYDNNIQSAGLELEYFKRFALLTLNSNASYNFYNRLKYYSTALYEDEVRIFPKILGNIMLTIPFSSRLSSTLWYHYRGKVRQYLTTNEFDEKHFVNLALSYQTKSYENRLKMTLSINDMFDEGDHLSAVSANTFKESEFVTDRRKFGLQVSYSF